MTITATRIWLLGFHGYDLSATPSVPYATQLLDSNPAAAIRGKFYVSAGSPVFTGMAFKLARAGNPGKLMVRFGSQEGAADLGEAEVVVRGCVPAIRLVVRGGAQEAGAA